MSNVTLPAVVLQTYSASTEGIVLTALPTAPFCCHEDLLTMSREKLEDVVHALNEKLPRRMRIGMAVEKEDQWVGDDDDDDEGIKGAIAGMSDADIRRKIEVLVGIRRREGLELGDLGVPFESVPADAPTLELLGTCTDAEVPVSFGAVDTPVHERWPVEDKDLAREIGVDGSHAKVEPSSSDIVPTSSPPRGRGHTLPPLTALPEEHETGEHDDTLVVGDQWREAGKEAENIEAEQATCAMERRHTMSTREETDLPAFIPTWSGPHGRLPTAQGSRLLENLEISASPLLDFDDEEVISATAEVTLDSAGDIAAKPAPGVNRIRRRRSTRTQTKPDCSTENLDAPGRQEVSHAPPSGMRKVKPRPLSFPIWGSSSARSNRDQPVDLGEGGGGGEVDEITDSDGGIRYDHDSGHNGGEESNDSQSRSSVFRVHPICGFDVHVQESSGFIGTGQEKLERSKSGRRPTRVPTNRLRKRLSLKRSSWTPSTLVPLPASRDYACGATLASESNPIAGATLKTGLGFGMVELDDDNAVDRQTLPVSMIGLHTRIGNANDFGFASSSSFLGSRSECEHAMSISTLTSVRDALDVDELSGNVCVCVEEEAELRDSEDDVPASPIVFASRDSGLVEMGVDLSQGIISERIWMALEKMEVLSVEAGVKV